MFYFLSMISEKTLIPLSLVLILSGGIFWLSSMDARTSSNAAAIERAEKKEDSLSDKMQEVSNRLSRIEGKLDRVIRNGP